MKRLKYILLMLFALAFTCQVNAQKATLKQANKFFNKLAYYKAVPLYQRVLEIDTANSIAIHNIAECYRKLNDYGNKEKYFAKVVTLPDVTTIEKYYYGMALMENNKYDEGKKWTSSNSIAIPYDETVVNKLCEIDKREDFFLDSMTSYTINNYSELNSDHSDFGAIQYKKGILFSSNRYVLDEMTNNHGWSGKDFYKLFYYDSVNKKAPIKFKSSVQNRLNDGPISYDKKNNTLYVTRNSVTNGKVIKSADKLIKLQIYAYKYDSAKQVWSNEVAFENNNKDYNVAHPAVSPDGTIMIFSSDMPNGYGGMDLYICKKRGDKWGIPINMGPAVNTKGDEVFPYINAGNLMIFSSNGFDGYGGLDLYYSYLSDIKACLVEHFVRPINSQFDDFCMILTDSSKNALFTSNRMGGNGDDDIYKVTINKKPKPIKVKPPKLIFDLVFTGVIRDKKTLDSLDSVKVVFTDEKAITYPTFSSNGKFNRPFRTVKVNDTIAVTIMLEKKGYLREELKLKYIVKDSIVDLNKYYDLLMTPLEAVVAADLLGRDLMKRFIINPIYFDFNKYNIRPDAALELDKIVKIMKDYPKMIIDMGSYSDCRGTALYNMKLSDNRAKSSITYIISKGINKSRVTGKGYGESKPVNECECEGTVVVPCTEPMHQLNRRTEFMVISM